VQSSFITGSVVDSATSSASIHLKFDRYLLPASVSRQSICVRAASAPVAAPGDCTQGQFLSPVYDPVKREVILRLSGGERLDQDAEYQITVFGPTEDGTPGIRAFDGAPLEQTLELAFTTALTDPAGGPAAGEDEVAYEEADAFCTVSARCLARCAGDMACEGLCQSTQGALQNCAFGDCHADGRRQIEGTMDSAYIGPAMGLVLCTSGPTPSCPDKYLSPMLATAVGKVAHQTQQGNSDPADVNPVLEDPRRFGRAMPIIDPQSPGNSYLVYKILAGIDPVAASDDNPAAAGEQNRLREAMVVGMTMPASGNPLGFSEGPPVSEMQSISNWIARGAPTKICP
jgi:hypothetical protein